MRLKTSNDFSANPWATAVQCKTQDEPDGCYPGGSACARKVTDGLFTKEDISALKEIALKGYATRESQGGPTILDINTGYIRDSAGMENLFARDLLTEAGAGAGAEKIFTEADFDVYGKVISRLRAEVMNTFGNSHLYFTAPTFITRLVGRADWEPKEIHDQYWHWHVDRNNTAHYHYSGLLYLSEYKKDFKGGRIIFYNADDSKVEQVVEPLPGRTIIFSSGHENPHKVERVTSGERLVLAFWFTCDKAKEFEIFLDGKAHDKFAHKVGTSYLKQQGQQQQRAEQQVQQQQAKVKADREAAGDSPDPEL